MSIHPLSTCTPMCTPHTSVCPICPYAAMDLYAHLHLHSLICLYAPYVCTPPYICVGCITVGQSYGESASLLVTCSVLYNFSNLTQCPYIKIYPNMYNLFQQNLEKSSKNTEMHTLPFHCCP